MVLTLLTKVVAFHVGLTPIGLRGPSFYWALSRLRWYLSLCCLYEHLHEFCKEVFGGGRNEKWSGSLWGSRSLVATSIGSSALGAGKLILLCGVNGRIDARPPLGSARSWSHCKGLIMILPNGLADPLGVELLEL